jgi:hypothetical protein
MLVNTEVTAFQDLTHILWQKSTLLHLQAYTKMDYTPSHPRRQQSSFIYLLAGDLFHGGR